MVRWWPAKTPSPYKCISQEKKALVFNFKLKPLGFNLLGVTINYNTLLTNTFPCATYVVCLGTLTTCHWRCPGTVTYTVHVHTCTVYGFITTHLAAVWGSLSDEPVVSASSLVSPPLQAGWEGPLLWLGQEGAPRGRQSIQTYEQWTREQSIL